MVVLKANLYLEDLHFGNVMCMWSDVFFFKKINLFNFVLSIHHEIYLNKNLMKLFDILCMVRYFDRFIELLKVVSFISVSL